MENYKLQSNETVLFKGEVDLIRGTKKIKAELILTNLNLIFIIKSKKFFHTELEKEVYDVKEIKIYDEKYQVIRKKKKVDIYMLSGEKFLEFQKEKQAKEFSNAVLRLVSGESKLVRGVKKVRKAVSETNDSLDIDVVEIAKKTANLAGEVAVAAATGAGAGKKTKMLGKIAGALMHKQSTTQNNLLEQPKSGEE
ncbi:MAG: hypothetical protein IJD54_04225 [Clostridia bacterium]|nr:hypothetical protein [Clostridia bacterium]